MAQSILAKSAPRVAQPSPSGSKRVRDQTDRRDVEEKTSRALAKFYSHVSKTQLSTTRVDNETIGEYLEKDFRAFPKKRRQAKFYDDLAEKFGFAPDGTTGMSVKDKSQVVTPELINALELATNTDNKKRDHK